MTFREGEAVGRLIGADVNRSGAAAYVRDEAGGRLDDARSPNSHENGAFPERLKDSFHVEGHFAEPADVRANPAAAFAYRNLGRRLEGARIVEGRTITGVAAALEKLSVHVDDAA